MDWYREGSDVTLLQHSVDVRAEFNQPMKPAINNVSQLEGWEELVEVFCFRLESPLCEWSSQSVCQSRVVPERQSVLTRRNMRSGCTRKCLCDNDLRRLTGFVNSMLQIGNRQNRELCVCHARLTCWLTDCRDDCSAATSSTVFVPHRNISLRC